MGIKSAASRSAVFNIQFNEYTIVQYNHARSSVTAHLFNVMSLKKHNIEHLSPQSYQLIKLRRSLKVQLFLKLRPKLARVQPSPLSNKNQGCHCWGKVGGRRKVFKVRKKSANLLKSQGKSLILSKSVKSQGILFSGL